MPEVTPYTPLQRERVRAIAEHLRIVIALQQEGTATGQSANDVRRYNAHIGQHTQPGVSVFKYKLHWLASIMGNRIGRN